jgi:hypothetical protein
MNTMNAKMLKALNHIAEAWGGQLPHNDCNCSDCEYLRPIIEAINCVNDESITIEKEVFIVLEDIPHQGSPVVGIRFNKESAIDLRDELCKKKSTSFRCEKWTENDEESFYGEKNQ